MKNNSAFLVTLDLTQPETHRVNVTIEAKGSDLPPLLQFPVWTPGSYMIREYSRHITKLDPAVKVAKNQWRLSGKPKSISYEVYCFERSVRTSFLDSNYAALVGATLLPLLHEPFELQVLLPKSWAGISSALKLQKKGPGRWQAFVGNDDDWIDKPLVAWRPGFGGVGKFRAAGITHHIAWVGAECARPMKDLETDFAKIVKSTVSMFGGAPFKEYWFLLHFGHRVYGGLEHRDSQLSQFDGSTLAERGDWNRFLKLIAHEYLHAWNVKSIRPQALGPFDYFSENYTPDIWFSEGITDYFDDIIPFQAGLYTEKEMIQARLKDVNLFPDGHPGHFRRSLAESSFDAWIRYYRPDEDTVNTDVSYYGKGAVLGWCWDAHLQKRSRKRWTLGKLMREFYKEFGINATVRLKDAQPGFTREQMLRFAEKKTGIAQRAVVEAWVTDRKPLPWRQAAKFFGVEWKENINSLPLCFLGCQVKWEQGKGSVQNVLSGSAAEAAGLAAGDEILAINGVRVGDQEKFSSALKNAMRSGKAAEFLTSRLDRVCSRSVKWRKHAGVGVEVQLA